MIAPFSEKFGDYPYLKKLLNLNGLAAGYYIYWCFTCRGIFGARLLLVNLGLRLLAPLAPCVTVIVRVGAPGAVTVITPVLAVPPVLAVTLIINEPLPVWFTGVIFEIFSHAALLDTAHVLSEIT